MLSVIVKGNKFQAARAAADRDIPFVFKTETKTGARSACETVGLVGEQHTDKVIAWFVEPIECVAGQGFPVGACLLYTIIPTSGGLALGVEEHTDACNGRFNVSGKACRNFACRGAA